MRGELRTAQISVILPARNAAHTLGRALESLRTQTLSDYELLAIDDASTDGTLAHLHGAAQHDPRIRVFRTEPGAQGLVAALNLGLHHATGTYIARMDADDESLPARFERSLAALEAAPSLAGLGTGVEIASDDRPPSPNLQRYGAWLNSLTTCEKLFADRFVESPLCHPTVMLRAEPLRAMNGWRDGDFPEDWDLWLRLLESGHRLRCLDEVLHRWFDHERRLTRTDTRYGPARHLSLKAGTLCKRFAGRSLAVWGAGEIGVKLTRALVERGLIVTRLVDLNPRKIGQRVHGARVVMPADLGRPDDEDHLLCAVGAKGARAEIRAHLESRGWVEGTHFTCVA